MGDILREEREADRMGTYPGSSPSDYRPRSSSTPPPRRGKRTPYRTRKQTRPLGPDFTGITADAPPGVDPKRIPDELRELGLAELAKIREQMNGGPAGETPDAAGERAVLGSRARIGKELLDRTSVSVDGPDA